MLDLNASIGIGGDGRCYGLSRCCVTLVVRGVWVCDSGRKGGFRGFYFEMAASAEESAFGIGSQRLDIAIVVLYETYFHSPVMTWGADETDAVAGESLCVKFDTDVKVLPCCAAEALSWTFAWVKVEGEALPVVVLSF